MSDNSSELSTSRYPLPAKQDDPRHGAAGPTRPTPFPDPESLPRVPARPHRRIAFSVTTSAILHFHQTGTIVSLGLMQPVILGRGTPHDMGEKLDLTDFKAYQLGVSRAHCQLQRSRYNLTATDLGSANGTFLNGERLMPHTSYNVEHGDILRLGSLEITVLFSGSHAS